MKKVISTLLTVSTFLTACSNEKQTIYVEGKNGRATDENNESFNLDSLINGEDSNLALAELLMPELLKKNLVVIPKASDIPNIDLQKQRVEDYLNKYRQQIIQGRGRFGAEKNDWRLSLAGQLSTLNGKSAFDSKLEIQTIIAVNKDSMKKIFDIYNKQIIKNSAAVAADVVRSSLSINPQIINQIDESKGSSIQERARAILPLLIKYDQVIARYDLPAEDNVKLLVYSAVAYELAKVLENNSSVKAILKTAQDVKDIADKAKEVIVLVSAADSYRKSLNADWEQMGSSLHGLIQSLKDYEFDLKSAQLSDESKVKILSAMKNVVSGATPEQNREPGNSFLSSDYNFSKDADNFIKSTTGVVNNVDKILQTTRLLTDKLGIKLSPEVSQVIDGVTKVNQALQVGKAVLSAFQGGGFIGAVGILAGGPGGGLLGGVGGDPSMMQVLADLKEIKQDVREIKVNVKEILELQKTNLEILKEMAVMIDYNQKELLKNLENIKEEVLVNRELILRNSLQDLGICASDVFIGAQRDEDLSISMYQRLKLEKSHLLSFRNSEYKRSNCHKAMTSAFSMEFFELTKERYTGSLKNRNVVELESELYQKALSYLKRSFPGSDWESMSLHIPVSDYSDLKERKNRHFDIRGTQAYSIKSLDSLLSADILEMYVVTLLQSHSVAAISLNPSEITLNSRRLLEMALNKVNAAIAQQAILAGEPLLAKLSQDWQQIVEGNVDCEMERSFCFVRRNSMMMHNLITYRLKAGLDYPVKYLLEMNIKELSEVFNIPEARVSLQDGQIYFRMGEGRNEVKVNVTKILKASGYEIKYDRSMVRLIELQSLLATELVKVSPKEMTREMQSYVKSSIVSAAQ